MYLLEYNILSGSALSSSSPWKVRAFCGKRNLLDRLRLCQQEPDRWRVRRTSQTCDQLLKNGGKSIWQKAG